ncbi:5'-nucleotidase C-terminal domain-containing protein [uncultured Sulfitobacter sp.]|uniref:5'-nucleotidase C-terminal domain-containing protein n=1 Tax=uncultured Sulfitobacter sp. TaxID=191468 RepID=UPI00262B0206|nr:5'-nucleotidase C-terminal domain-containing protein [uncultured Sulfitobacter sp.]
MSAPDTQKKTSPRVRIRLLATTDLHGHLLPHDYIKDQPTQGGGLAGLARLITEARDSARIEGMPVILLDNGDTFQGTPLATYLADCAVDVDHPIVAALNHLKYDALGLGNHDLDHGLPYLRAVASRLDMPILNSNLRNIDISPLQQSTLLPVYLDADAPAPLTLGVLSVLPPQSAAWQSHHLACRTSLEQPAAAIATGAAALRRNGADLIVVLGHMGVGRIDGSNNDARAAHSLVETGEIDALILGHTHRRLPSTDYASREGVDFQKSTVGNVPTIMAGHAGSDLGIMDLTLVHDEKTGWRILDHHAYLRPNGGNVKPDPFVVEIAQTTHETVRCHLTEQVATTPTHLHSYFSLMRPAPTQQLTALAQYRQVRDALRDGPFGDLPVLSCAAAHGAGGRDGPANYVNIPAGPVLRRHIAGLNPFANQTVGLRITGAQLKNWLEHAALLFNLLRPDAPAQMLIDRDIPAFQFDTIFGLHYQIDPSASPLNRISQLEFGGNPLQPDQEFILATNRFRASGGGGFPILPASLLACRVGTQLGETMIEVLNSTDPQPWDTNPPWRFAPLGGVEAIVLTHPEALHSISEISHLKPKSQGTTPEGFIRLSVTL